MTAGILLGYRRYFIHNLYAAHINPVVFSLELPFSSIVYYSNAHEDNSNLIMFYAFAPAFSHHATPFSCEYLNAKMLHTCQNNQIYELTQAVLSRAAKIQHFDILDFLIYIC